MKTILTFLAPLIISIVILGLFSVRNTQSYVQDNLKRSNTIILQQTQDTVESVMRDVNIISLNYTINTKAQYALRQMLQKETLDYEDIRELEIFQNNLRIAHYTRPYIQSIYVYFDNPQKRFITSEAAHASLYTFLDTAWYDNYQDRNSWNSTWWWEVRNVPRNSWSEDEIEVLTFYKLIYNSSMRNFNGVVVFNVYHDYIQNFLNGLEYLTDDHSIMILDDYRILASTNDKYDYLLQDINNFKSSEFNLRRNGQQYTISSSRQDPDLNFRYVSIVPNDSLYSLPNYLFRLNLIYILISLVAGLGLSLYFARNANKQNRTIIEIINSAKEGKLKNTEMLTSRAKNPYQYILYNIINSFIEKDYLRIQLSEKQYKSRVDELIALQSQINPHFLFNTLQTISMRAMALGAAGRDVKNMIEDLSLILRYSLTGPGSLVSMQEEISHAKSYIAIQSIRYRDKMQVHWDYDESILDRGTIKLMFQPFLENSIYHGIRELDRTGTIIITMREMQDHLTIIIADNGIGIPLPKLCVIKDKLLAPSELSDHIGLYNTNRRIKLTFGEQYGISIESEEGLGTEVTITLPIIALNESYPMVSDTSLLQCE